MRGTTKLWVTPTRRRPVKAHSALYTATQETRACQSPSSRTTTPMERPARVKTASTMKPMSAIPRGRFPSPRTDVSPATCSRPVAADRSVSKGAEGTTPPHGPTQPPWTLSRGAPAFLWTSSTVAEWPRPEDTALYYYSVVEVSDARLEASHHERRRGRLLHLIPDR